MTHLTFKSSYQMCLCNVCKIWPKRKFCLSGRGGYFCFDFCWVCPGIDHTHETERRKTEEAPVSVHCSLLVSQMPGSTDGLYDHYGLETRSMKSNLSFYRKKKKRKKYMNVGLLPTWDSLNQQWEWASYQRVCWSKFPLPGQDLLSLLAIRGRKK